jgi:hypothetical protein
MNRRIIILLRKISYSVSCWYIVLPIALISLGHTSSVVLSILILIISVSSVGFVEVTSVGGLFLD